MDRKWWLTADRIVKIVDEGVAFRWGVNVRGIEVTQAVQYFDAAEHLTDSADRGANNTVSFVAGKPAWVRVYVGSWFGSAHLSGSLEVQRRSNGFLWNTVATLSPDPSSATSVPASGATSYAATRGSLGSTLNFLIPAGEMIGTLRLIARVTSDFRGATATVDIAVTLRQRLRLAGVMIAYNGPSSMAAGAPNLTIAAPALTDLQAMSGTALTLFPVEASADFRTAGTLTLTNHLQDTTFPTSGCGAGWDALHAAVANARTADGNQPGWIYYGLLPSGVPMGPVGGCGGGGVAVGPINQPGTLAHEAGHACGLGHAPGGGAPNPDPSYPAYEPYDPPATPQASTGEYGLNVNNGAIASPQTFRDFMSYAGPAWISLYHYGRLLNNATLNPATVGVDHPWWKDLVWQERLRWPPIPPLPDPPFKLDLELPVFPPSRAQDVISLIVKIERGKVAEVLHVARALAHPELAGAADTSFSAVLRDAEGAVVAQAALMRLRTHACGCGGGGREEAEPTSYIAQGFLQDAAPGAALEILDADETVWRRAAPSEPPRVAVRSAEVDQDGRVTVAWDATDAVLEFWLRWSPDGKTWQSVATELRDTRAQLDAGRLPSGDGLLQVVAHDGFFSAYSDPVAVNVPDRGPDVAILHPLQDHTYIAGQTVRLWASVAGATGEDAVWSVDGSEVARGLDAWVVLEPGERTITVRVGERTPSEAGVTVKVDREPR